MVQEISTSISKKHKIYLFPVIKQAWRCLHAWFSVRIIYAHADIVKIDDFSHDPDDIPRL
jgi:hypothetical protein